MRGHQLGQLKPYQVALQWNRIGKALQRSGWEEHHNFWKEHQASMKVLIDHTINTANDFDGRATATATHSMAKILSLTAATSMLRKSSRVQYLWKILLICTVKLLQSEDKLNPQDISNLCWAYAKVGLGHVDMRILDLLIEGATQSIADFKPQALANTVWAFATLNHEAPALFDTIAAASQSSIADFKPQELANTAWAFAIVDFNESSILASPNSPFIQAII